MRLYTVYYISVNSSTRFGWWLHPSSGTHITVITTSGTGQTVSATFCCRGAVVTAVPTAPRQRKVAETVWLVPGVVITVMCSWWWVESPPETCRAVYRNIINCNCSSNCSTTAEGSRVGLTGARCCNYSYMCSWWWVELPPETCRAVYRNIVNCI
jgi:hypothetical protein